MSLFRFRLMRLGLPPETAWSELLEATVRSCLRSMPFSAA